MTALRITVFLTYLWDYIIKVKLLKWLTAALKLTRSHNIDKPCEKSYTVIRQLLHLTASWKLELPTVLNLWCFTSVQTHTWCILMKPLKKNSLPSSLWQFMKQLVCDDRLLSMRAGWYDTQASSASLSHISVSHFTLAGVIDRISLICFFFQNK